MVTTKTSERKELPPLSPATGSAIIVTDEMCLLHADINPTSNIGTAALDGYAHDDAGNEWQTSAYVNVKWKRTATGFGKCNCGGNMVSKAPNNKNARVRCHKCGTQMLLTNWRRISQNDKLSRGRENL